MQQGQGVYLESFGRTPRRFPTKEELQQVYVQVDPRLFRNLDKPLINLTDIQNLIPQQLRLAAHSSYSDNEFKPQELDDEMVDFNAAINTFFDDVVSAKRGVERETGRRK